MGTIPYPNSSTVSLASKNSLGEGYSINQNVLNDTLSEPVLKSILLNNLNGVSNAFMTKSDFDDYATRFFNADVHNFTDTPSDIAYFNVLNNAVDSKGLHSKRNEVIFPKESSLSQIGISSKFRQFIVTQVSEASGERFQISENSDSFTLNFFEGRRPEILQISGILKNSQDNPWNMNMLLIWEGMIRGSLLAKNNYIMQLHIDGILYYGYPLNFQRNKVAGSDFIVNFSMSFIVREKTPLNTRYPDIGLINEMLTKS